MIRLAQGKQCMQSSENKVILLIIPKADLAMTNCWESAWTRAKNFMQRKMNHLGADSMYRRQFTHSLKTVWMRKRLPQWKIELVFVYICHSKIVIVGRSLSLSMLDPRPLLVGVDNNKNNKNKYKEYKIKSKNAQVCPGRSIALLCKNWWTSKGKDPSGELFHTRVMTFKYWQTKILPMSN